MEGIFAAREGILGLIQPPLAFGISETMVEAAGVEPFVPLILRNLQILQYAKMHKKARMPAYWYKFGYKYS